MIRQLNPFAVVMLAGGLFYAQAARAQTGADPMSSMQFLVGHWTCTSVTGGKTTSYTTDWELVPGGRWMRGTNRSGTSASEDLETYDLATKAWRTVDLEPDGSMSVLVSSPGAGAQRMATQSVYPDDSQRVTFEKESENAYRLAFDFVVEGKHETWEDDCTRTGAPR